MPTVPPPPPLPLSSININSKKNSIDQNNNKLQFSECLWAVGDPEVQRACFFARTCLHTSPKECTYLRVEPILQTGPTCGLCALSMVYCGTPTADDLLETAIKCKYTNNGEMFSASWLLSLLKQSVNNSSLNPGKVKSYIYDGDLDSEFIKEKLKQHCMLLVPYDADRNHSPSNQNGHKAHWCLICGYLIEDTDNFHVFARHGKTKNLGLFSLKHLSESNGNLKEFAQPSWHPNETFLLPDGGLGGSIGLRNKSIVVEGLTNDVVKVV
ncbi:CLUMA_CG008040, isoform A [Clunio marinus]|uniref:Actin maturation protease n=1 Tax=Clunio marinus TaxID=568069 RepID=A0A1J1I806_9DIPT|nr:CLUMA_CG008040, isoform A [Clunio marinus]